MEEEISEKKASDIGTLIIIGIIIIGILIYHYRKDSSVTEYKTETVGKITDFRHRKDFSYSLKYEYYVDGIKYEGSVGTGFFKCADGTKGCVGKEVTVFYSSKEPKYSQVDLGEYEEHKTTIYLKE
jgi:hypothetical protein